MAPARGWFVALVFGFGTMVALASVVLRGRLDLSPEGMRVTHLGRRQPLLDWRCCSDFRPWLPGYGTQIVVFDYDDPEPHWRGRAARASAAVSGANAGLPDDYGMNAEALAGLLSAYRDAATGATSEA